MASSKADKVFSGAMLEKPRWATIKVDCAMAM
jgi:hypothetical protein